VSGEAPAVSVGLAVRNGRRHLGRCIDSVLSQDLHDLELVVCDNASDDGTQELVERYAHADPRVRLLAGPVDIGVHRNMGRALQAAQGTYVRWISADDWLEPGCLTACVRALDQRPHAIGVTTWFTIHTPGGATRYEEYEGEFPDSPDAARRFERMLWFFHAGDARYDPIYGMYRREAALRAWRPRQSERADWLLSAELALRGPIAHVHERLAHRTRDYAMGIDRAAFRRRLDPILGELLRTSPNRLHGDLLALARSAGLTDEQLGRCRAALRRFWVRELARSTRGLGSYERHRLVRRSAKAEHAGGEEHEPERRRAGDAAVVARELHPVGTGEGAKRRDRNQGGHAHKDQRVAPGGAA
jgi:glycosyltransferase involved in cell wall biosynthesis